MKQVIIILGCLLSFTTVDAQFDKLLKSGKDAAAGLKKVQEKVLPGGDSAGDQLDIAGGLKEALNAGVAEAVSSLSAQDGYLASPYKLLIPADAQSAISKLKRVPGFRDVEDKMIAKMNEAAELAAQEATPIFVKAIKDLTIKDAKEILFGEENAATHYLEGSARQSLYDLFLPIIQNALSEVGATKYWNQVFTKYNALPLTQDINPELDDHVNNSALDGLFGLISVKEQGIRNNLSERTSPLLQKVFAQLD